MDVKPVASNMASVPVPAGQVVYLMSPQQGQTSLGIRPVPGVRCLSISILVIGVLITLLGIVAVILKTFFSYIGDPIWSGLLFFIVTGILGICVYKRSDNNKIRIAFLVMTIISSLVAFQLLWLSWPAAANERYGCIPGPSAHHFQVSCLSPAWTRSAVSVVIGFLTLAILILCIVSCSVTIYGLCRCCYECCGGVPTEAPVMVHYDPNTGVAMAPITGMEGYEVTTVPTQHQNIATPIITQSQNPPSATAQPQESITNGEPEVIETKGLLGSKVDTDDDNNASGDRQNWETFS